MSTTILIIQIMLLAAPAFFTFVYSLVKYRTEADNEQLMEKLWVLRHRCGSFLFLCWCAYAGFTWVILHRMGLFETSPTIFSVESDVLLASIVSRLFFLSVGILAVFPIASSATLYILVLGWADRRLRNEKYSLFSFLRFNLAQWLWSASRYLVILVLLMSETFFFSFNRGETVFNVVNSISIVLLFFVVYFYAFPFTQKLFRIAMPMKETGILSHVTDFSERLGVSVKHVFRMRTFDLPVANGLVTSSGDIYLTDMVIDAFEPEEAAAVVAHEVAHLKQMKERTWLILCSRFIIALLALGVFPFVFNNFPDIRYIFLVCSLGFYGALWLISNEKKLQRKYERKADDLAVDLVGSECYAHMLELLHSINMIPRNFSENNKKYSSHPDLEERKNNIQKGLV